MGRKRLSLSLPCAISHMSREWEFGLVAYGSEAVAASNRLSGFPIGATNKTDTSGKKKNTTPTPFRGALLLLPLFLLF